MHQSPLHDLHVRHGARLIDFAGWQMPIMYRSIHEEHRQVRHVGGLFDVSHMGRLKLRGSGARRLLERVLTRRVSDMSDFTCRYSMICNDVGGVRDDVIVYRFDDHWMLVVNAANRAKIVDHLHDHTNELSVDLQDITFETAMIAVQGPRVMELFSRFSNEVPALKRYAFCVKHLLTLKLIISRTGYTGEDGVEVIFPAGAATTIHGLLEHEADDIADALRPIGLGARDTLRMEAGMPLYGHELAEEVDPLSAGLTFAVSLDKHTHDNGERFVGQDALERIANAGLTRRLIGLQLDGKRTARQGMDIAVSGQTVGQVTSGCLSPTLGMPLAMAYVDADATDAESFEIALGAKSVNAASVALPFYKPERKR